MSDQHPTRLDYAPPATEALPPVTPGTWWARLIVLGAFGLAALVRTTMAGALLLSILFG